CGSKVKGGPSNWRKHLPRCPARRMDASLVNCRHCFVLVRPERVERHVSQCPSRVVERYPPGQGESVERAKRAETRKESPQEHCDGKDPRTCGEDSPELDATYRV